jgi:pimeloyl-ACP methyl ester carboxylesterase
MTRKFTGSSERVEAYPVASLEVHEKREARYLFAAWLRLLVMNLPIEPSESELPGIVRMHSTSIGRRRWLFGMAVSLGIAGCASNMAAKSPAPMSSARAPVNGISMYYEVHGRGDGTPLVLLHGGGSTIESNYGKLLPLFARHRKVIALEEQAHGRTTDRDGPVRFDTSADDVAALLRHLGIDKADVMGFSNGASVAMKVAIRHPALVRKLVFASSFTKKSGAPPQFWEFIGRATFADMPQPLKDAFLKVNPDPKKLRAMHDKDLERMQNFVETSDEEVRSVKVPTLIVLGDRDIVKLEHASELIRLMPQSHLIILPGGHGDYLGEVTVAKKDSRYPELTAALIEEFLDGSQ